MPIGRKHEKTFGYILTLRTKDKIMGNTNNFVCQLPTNFATHHENYSIQLVNAHIPLPQYDNNTDRTHLYRTAGVEVCVDFGAKTNSLDTSKASLQSYGWLKMPESVITSQTTALENDGDKPEHIVSNPNFQNITIQLKDSDGNFLLSYSVSDSSTAFPPNSVFQFSFTPIQ